MLRAQIFTFAFSLIYCVVLDDFHPDLKCYKLEHVNVYGDGSRESELYHCTRCSVLSPGKR